MHLSPYRLPLTRALTDSYHTMRCQSVIKTNQLWITSNDHFTTKIICFSNLKLFGCYTSMIIYIQNHVSFVGSKFSGSHHRLRKPSYTSLAFTVGHICITKNNGAFTREGIYPYLLLPDTYFHFHVYNRATLLDVFPP